MHNNRRYSKTHTLLFILLSIAVAAVAWFGTFSRRPAVVQFPGTTASMVAAGPEKSLTRHFKLGPISQR